MKYIVFLSCLLLISCANQTQKQDPYVEQITQLRKDKNAKMMEEGSPLTSYDRSNFIGLNYFPVKKKWRIKSKFELLSGQKVFKMQTNTERSPVYMNYAKLSFQINGTALELFAYKSLESNLDELFVPFNDLTNGKETYQTGRYIDLEIPEGDSLFIDFNTAYNPYCAYNHKYSCPIPPSENSLPIKVTAGERVFH